VGWLEALPGERSLAWSCCRLNFWLSYPSSACGDATPDCQFTAVQCSCLSISCSVNKGLQDSRCSAAPPIQKRAFSYSPPLCVVSHALRCVSHV
jgi:hypothetical protein